MRSTRFVVAGRVQGVGFRYFVSREAEALDLVGWVRNLPDGGVEVVAAGDDVAVNTLEGRLWTGPPRARVTTVTAAVTEPPTTSGFRILSTRW